jgi:hypothetical protein
MKEMIKEDHDQEIKTENKSIKNMINIKEMITEEIVDK